KVYEGTGGETGDETSGPNIFKLNKTPVAGSIENYQLIKNFVSGSDTILALDTDFAFQQGANDGVVALATHGATLDGVIAANANFTVATIGANLVTPTFTTFLAGTSSILELEISAASATDAATNANFQNTDKFLVAIDDAVHTGIFFVESGADNNAIEFDEISLLAILEGVTDATTLVADNFAFA
ncbi:hypothetical protein N9E48_09900, partial [Paracoccaceae bacterium]|nr:hypothetical protein [Paracoccaceae bacterium]